MEGLPPGTISNKARTIRMSIILKKGSKEKIKRQMRKAGSLWLVLSLNLDPAAAPTPIAANHPAKIRPRQSSFPKKMTSNSRIKKIWAAIE